MAPALAQRFSQLLLSMTESGHQLAKPQRFFDCAEVGPLDVLDDSDFKDFCIVEIAKNNGQLM